MKEIPKRAYWRVLIVDLTLDIAINIINKLKELEGFELKYTPGCNIFHHFLKSRIVIGDEKYNHLQQSIFYTHKFEPSIDNIKKSMEGLEYSIEIYDADYKESYSFQTDNFKY